MSLLRDIAAYCERTGMTATAFGVEAMGDSNFVHRGGNREHRASTVRRAYAFMAKHPDGCGGAAGEDGAALVARLRAAAERRGVSAKELAAPLALDPRRWLAMLAHTRHPTKATRERVAAVIAGEVPQPRRRVPPKRTARHTAVDHREPPVPADKPLERRSCSWCGVRSDIGCRHLGWPAQGALGRSLAHG